LPAFERLGETRETAIAWGQIADIAYQRGDHNEALRIHRELQLPAYERLGDTRSTAITWGNIANISYRRGDCGEAAELQRKRLEVNRQLGDLDGIAATGWDLARIDSRERTTSQRSPGRSSRSRSSAACSGRTGSPSWAARWASC